MHFSISEQDTQYWHHLMTAGSDTAGTGSLHLSLQEARVYIAKFQEHTELAQ